MMIAVESRINDVLVGKVLVPDPIHSTEVKMGWWSRLRFLFSRGRVEVSVRCSTDVSMLILDSIPDEYKHSRVLERHC